MTRMLIGAAFALAVVLLAIPCSYGEPLSPQPFATQAEGRSNGLDPKLLQLILKAGGGWFFEDDCRRFDADREDEDDRADCRCRRWRIDWRKCHKMSP